jgi:hypothetical protein
MNDIDLFSKKNKSKNDSYNKKRENIIAAIINNNIPKEYYSGSHKWRDLKMELYLYIQILGEENGIETIDNVICDLKGGRGNHHDMIITINNNKLKVEFKYGASCADEAPQFLSPMKPSNYLSMDFEPYYYDNYLPKIASFGNLKLPEKEEYCKSIHNNKVECMIPYKHKYDNDSSFNKICKQVDKEAIKKFIEITEIVPTKLSEKLVSSQKDKNYMCYSNGKFHYDKLSEDIYILDSLVKKEKTNYIYSTKSGMKLEIKLRFKNGCGLQFPAFQIKRKIPTVKELKNICKTHDIIPPKKKKDILDVLNENNIIY